MSTAVESLHHVSLYPSHATCNDLEVIVDSKPLLLVYIKYVIRVSPPHMKKQTNGVAFPRKESKPMVFKTLLFPSLVLLVYATVKCINFKLMYWSYSCEEKNYFEDYQFARLCRVHLDRTFGSLFQRARQNQCILNCKYSI